MSARPRFYRSVRARRVFFTRTPVVRQNVRVRGPRAPRRPFFIAQKFLDRPTSHGSGK